MSATEEMRRLLDERGVRHFDTGGVTEFVGSNGRICRTYTRPEPITVDVAIIAAKPEQAVEATFGRGTCHVEDYEGAGIGVCSECGAAQPDDYTVYYCWNCGAKVVG